VEHDTPEFGRSIIRGTMLRMQKLSKAKGFPINSYYKVPSIL
jgi:hypothetical protein